MVVGKLLMAGALIVGSPAQAQLVLNESLYTIYSSINRFFDRLTEDDRRKIQQSVYTALHNLDNGEIIRWYSDTSYNHGIVEVVATAQLSGRLCRRIYITVNTERTTQTFEHWGCYNESTKTWQFHK